MYYQVALTPVLGQVSFRIGRYAKMPLTGGNFVLSQREKESAAGKGKIDVLVLKDLIERSQEGDTLAISALYEQYKRPLFSLIYRHTYNYEAAEDLLQDIFVKIFTHLGSLQNYEMFNGWAYRIALNTCYSYLRSKKSKLRDALPLDEAKRVVNEDRHGVQEKEMRKPLDEAIESLPRGLKSVFLLHDVQGFKHEEIARTLGCSTGTSKSQLFKARMRIRAYLKDKNAL
jgi:RNA polymerase sigma-70 factor (ECF subfamily)